MCQRTYSICDAPLWRSARRSFASLQKSRRNHRSYMWTKALVSGLVFVLAQKLFGNVWVQSEYFTFIAWLSRNEINFCFDVRHHFTLAFSQAAIVVYNKALSCVRVQLIDWFGTGVLGLPVRFRSYCQKAKKKHLCWAKNHVIFQNLERRSRIGNRCEVWLLREDINCVTRTWLNSLVIIVTMIIQNKNIFKFYLRHWSGS